MTTARLILPEEQIELLKAVQATDKFSILTGPNAEVLQGVDIRFN